MISFLSDNNSLEKCYNQNMKYRTFISDKVILSYGGTNDDGNRDEPYCKKLWL